MKISTFSVVVGSMACNATCPFCVSKMTGAQNQTEQLIEPNWRNFAIACKLAKQSNVTTAMITGKGEPTLFPELISSHIVELANADIPLIELQTNGIRLANESLDDFLSHWYGLGLTTIAISIVSSDREANQMIYGGEHFDLSELIEKLHKMRYTVRLSCILLEKNANYSFLEKMVNFARSQFVEQLTFIPLNNPTNTESKETNDWVKANKPSDSAIEVFWDHIHTMGTKLLELPHGATIYDINGQNVCLSNCLVGIENKNEMRNLIFYPNGRLAYDWRYKGAIIL